MAHLSSLTRENEALLSGAYSVRGLKRRWGPLAEALIKGIFDFPNYFSSLNPFSSSPKLARFTLAPWLLGSLSLHSTYLYSERKFHSRLILLSKAKQKMKRIRDKEIPNLELSRDIYEKDWATGMKPRTAKERFHEWEVAKTNDEVDQLQAENMECLKNLSESMAAIARALNKANENFFKYNTRVYSATEIFAQLEKHGVPDDKLLDAAKFLRANNDITDTFFGCPDRLK
ncbi:hypothetical protein FCM35_KLT03196 [Carex littledalei]|uniref:Uncharacterized protein n=1 Tax=Carex littledalei TaxID=544730 RepID=A0A833QR27_9POAL|nr:hypothetical protein FCM35_KLT03196 [Carex littledalei]